jgi:hypothetical protein
MSSIKKTSSARTIKHKRTAQPKNTAIALLRRIQTTRVIAAMIGKMQDLLRRRPHRSFRRTYRRDYIRLLDIPGYWAFTNLVRHTLWGHRKLFACVVIAYALITIAVVNLSSEALYSQMRDTINQSSGETFVGAWGEVGKAGLLLVAGVTGSFNESSATTQTQVYVTLIGLLTWLTIVWLLRAILAGRKPKMRDGLYNAGAPIVSTFLVATVIVFQLLPLALAIFGYNAAVASGLLEGGVEAMMFWSVAGLLTVLSLYWITSTIFALVVVTLPGMYPMQALRTAGDLVIGRRVRILLRLLWMAMIVVLTWVVTVIPIILFDGWLKAVLPSISWLPLVPLTLLIMGSLTIVWSASYVYLLYRRIVEDDALPA